MQIYIELYTFKDMLYIVIATSTGLSGADYMWLWIKKFILQEAKK